MEEEEELQMADGGQERRVKAAWKAVSAGPPLIEASLGAVSKQTPPAVNLPVPVANIDNAFKPLEKQYKTIQSKTVKATARAAKDFTKAAKAADAGKVKLPELPAKRDSLSAACLQLLLKIDEMLEGLNKIARANIPIQNEFRRLQADLKKAANDAKKERDKKKSITITLLGESVNLRAGDVPKAVSAANKLGTELKKFDSGLADLMSAWTKDRQALMAYRDRINGFNATQHMS